MPIVSMNERMIHGVQTCPALVTGQVIGSLFEGGKRGGEITLHTNDGNKEQEYCAGLGMCDFSTGEVRLPKSFRAGKPFIAHTSHHDTQ